MDTVNAKLRKRYEESAGRKLREVAVINFPGFKGDGQGTLGSFVSNISG